MPVQPKPDRVHYTLSVPTEFRDKLNDTSAKTGVPATVILQRLFAGWTSGAFTCSTLAKPPK